MVLFSSPLKGEQGFKTMDRASGSEYSQDPDSLLDIIDLILEDEFKQAYLDDQNDCLALESSLESLEISSVNSGLIINL